MSTKIRIFLENNPCEKRGDHHGGKGGRERDAGYHGACLALERNFTDGGTFIHGEFSLFPSAIGKIQRNESRQWQRHEPAHMKNAVQEPEKIRVFVLRYNLAHNVRNAFSGDTRNATANGNIDTGLDTYAPGKLRAS